MKDLLGKSSWWNSPAKNKTQTFYTRFLKGPSGEVKSSFTESKKAFEDFGKDCLKTRYSEMMEK